MDVSKIPLIDAALLYGAQRALADTWSGVYDNTDSSWGEAGNGIGVTSACH